MLSDHQIEIHHKSSGVELRKSHLSNLINIKSSSKSSRNHKQYIVECAYSLFPILSFTKHLLNHCLSTYGKLNAIAHRRVLMGKHDDFECIISEAEQRKFRFGIKHSASFPSWIVTYFLPTNQYQGCIPKTSTYSRLKWDKMRRYCLDEVALQFHRFSDYFQLCHSSNRILFDDNAGGNSHISESLSFEILHKLFNQCNIKLLKTELEIKYWRPHWKKTDYMIELNEMKYGVSVTRAMKCHGDKIFNEHNAKQLLTKKFEAINDSTIGVQQRDVWIKQILHIFAMNQRTANVLYKVYNKLKRENPMLVGDTIVVVTVTNNERQARGSDDWYYKLWGSCDWIYFNIFP